MAKEIKFNVRLSVSGKEQLVTATASVADMRRAMEGAKDRAWRLRDQLLNFNQSVQAVQNATNAVSQLTNTLNSVTEENRSFGAAMKAANTMAGKDAEGFAELKGRVAELSKTIPMARDQLANGLYQVISNGVPENNWLSYLQASARSAVGGIADVGEVVKVTSTIIKNYGLEWDAAEDIQDKIQLTAKNGVTSFEQLAAALPSVTGQAAQAGVSLTEMLAVMSTLTGVTGNTSEVSTQLASVLTAMTKETEKSQKVADAMGISFNAASIKASGGLKNYLQELDRTVTAYSAKTGELKESIYSKLFGRAEALRLVNALTGQLAEKYDENIAALQNSEGTMNAAYDDMASTGAARLQTLKNEWGGYTDWIADKVGGILPLLNFGSQLGLTMTSVVTLTQAFKKLHLVQSLMSKSVFRNIVVYTLFGTNARRVAAATHIMSQSFRSAATRALALKIMLRGLMAATGIGLAVTALSIIIAKLAGAFDNSAKEAEKAAGSMEKLGDEAKSTADKFERHRSDALAPLLASYEKLRASWSALKTGQEKNKFIKDNSAEFERLGLSINSVKDAENFLVSNTASVVAALNARAEAAAAAAMAEEKMKEALEAEAEAKKINKGNRAKYIKEHRTGHTAEDLATEMLVGNGAIRVTSRRQREAEARAAAARKEAGEFTGRSVEAARKAGQILHPGSRKTSPEDTAPRKTGAQAGKAVAGKKEEPAVEGSMNWYQKRLDDLRKKIEATGDAEVAKALQADYKAVEDEFKTYKIKIGVEKPEKEEARTAMDGLQDELAAARREFDNAVTVEAKVKAQAKADEIQAEIDEATTGRVTIGAEVEPSFIELGSDADKRQSYSNAMQKAGRIQQDYEIGLVGKDKAMEEMAELNLEIERLGLKPVEIEVMTGDVSKAEDRFQGAAEAIGAMGQAFSGLGGALELPELNIAGTIAQAIATMTQGYATATTQAAKLGPWAWIAFAATGLAQLAAMISSVKQVTAFANGGIVSGPTYALVGEYAGASNNPEVIAPLDKLRNMIQPPGGTGGTVRFEIDGRKLVGVIANETRIGSKSGRRTNIKI